MPGSNKKLVSSGAQHPSKTPKDRPFIASIGHSPEATYDLTPEGLKPDSERGKSAACADSVICSAPEGLKPDSERGKSTACADSIICSASEGLKQDSECGKSTACGDSIICSSPEGLKPDSERGKSTACGDSIICSSPERLNPAPSAGGSAPLASPVRSVPSHAFTWPMKASKESQKPTSAPQLSLASTRKQPPDAPPEEHSHQRSVEPVSAVADAPRSDSSAGYYVPDTRLFTICRQATLPPSIQSQEVEPLPIVVRPTPPPTKVGSSANQTEGPSGSVARSYAFTMGFPVTKQRPNVAPSAAKTPGRTSTSEPQAQPPAAQERITQPRTSEIPTRAPTTEITPRSVETSRFLLEIFDVKDRELAVPQSKESDQLPRTANAGPPSSNFQSHPSANVRVPRTAMRNTRWNITLADMAESFKDKSWMRQSPDIRAKIPEASTVSDNQQQLQVVEEEVEEDTRVSYSQGYFCAVAFCVLLILLLALIILLWWSFEGKTKKLVSTCSSPSCIREALYLDNLLSWEEEKPCYDFYSFVCSRWSSQYAVSSFFTDDVSIDDDYAVYLERRFNALIQNKRGPMSDLHAKCMNYKLINDVGWEPLLELLYHVSLEGFPLTPPIRKISVWRTAAQVIRKTGTAALFSVGVASHPTEAAKDVVSVGPPEMLTSGAVRLDINHAISLYTSSVFSAKRALSKQFVPPVYATDVVRFATNLEKLGQWRPHTAGDAKMDVANAQSPLLEFLTEVFGGNSTSIFSGEGTDVLIESPGTVNNIIKLVKGEQVHTVLNYLCVRLMIQTSPLIPDSDLTSFYATLVYGRRRSAMGRWELCVRVVDRALFPLVAASLLAQLRTPVAKYDDLASGIKAAFQRTADASPYLDVASKGAIRNLLTGTNIRVFSPQWVTEPNLVTAYEHSLPAVKEDANALETFIALHEYTFLDSLARGSAQRWRRSFFAFDCWYEPDPNTVYVPLLVFNVLEDFAEGKNPLQIPRAGPRVGKCLFDMLMMYLPADVTLDDATEKEDDNWLTAPTRAKLQDVESCLTGVLTSDITGFDRFRDVLALRAAHSHFQDKARGLSLLLRNGRVLTEDELFFIIAVLQACRKSASHELRTEAGYGWLVALRNSKSFSASFNCSGDDPMNPDHKCVD
ncbi:hypothetical protein MTO96_029933 [Rhipicephalus appendiculatus]